MHEYIRQYRQSSSNKYIYMEFIVILLSKCSNCNCHRTSGNRAVVGVALVVSVSVVIGFW